MKHTTIVKIDKEIRDNDLKLLSVLLAAKKGIDKVLQKDALHYAIKKAVKDLS